MFFTLKSVEMRKCAVLAIASTLSCSEAHTDSSKKGNQQKCSATTAPYSLPQSSNQSGYGIINGEFTDSYPAVVMLTINLGNRIGVCSATFIGHNVLATAGHCVDDATVDAIKIHIGNSFIPVEVARLGTGLPVLKKFTKFPSNQKDPDGRLVALDFALLQTLPDQAPAIAPLSNAAPPLNSYLQIVGFGNTNSNGSGSGTKRRAQTQVIDNGFQNNSQVPGAIFTFEGPPSGSISIGRVAEGDSGGPLFDQNLNLVGVTSIGITFIKNGIERNASGFNSILSPATQQVIQEARSAGAAIGSIKSDNTAGQPLNPYPSNGSDNGYPNPCI